MLKKTIIHSVCFFLPIFFFGSVFSGMFVAVATASEKQRGEFYFDIENQQQILMKSESGYEINPIFALADEVENQKIVAAGAGPHFFYTVRIDHSYIPHGLLQAYVEIPYLKKRGLDCWLDTAAVMQASTSHVYLYCGQSLTLNGIVGTVQAARKNHLSFLVVLAPFSDAIPINTFSVKKAIKKSKEQILGERIAKAYELLNGGELESSQRIFSEIRDLDPDNIDAGFGLALVEVKHGNWPEAYSYVQPLEKRTKRKDVQDLLKVIQLNEGLSLGWALVESDPQRSIEAFTKAKEFEDTLDVQKGIAYATYNLGDNEKALVLFREVFQQKPDINIAEMILITMENMDDRDQAVDFYNSLTPELQASLTRDPVRYQKIDSAAIYIKNCEYGQAETSLMGLFEKNPEDVDVLMYLGWLYLEKQEYVKAEDFYRRALEVDPYNISAVEGAVGALLAQFKEDEALEFLDEMSSAGMNVYYEKEKVQIAFLRRTGKINDAIEIALKLLEEKPGDPGLLILIADMYSQKGDPKTAFYYYTKAYDFDPNSFEVKMHMMQFYLKEKKFSQVKQMLAGLQETPIDCSNIDDMRLFYKLYYIEYSSYQLGRKNFLQAKFTGARGLKLFPNNPALLTNIAWAEFNLNNYLEAINFFQASLDNGATDINIYYGLGLSYHNLDNRNRAMQSFAYVENSEEADLLYKLADFYRRFGEIERADRVAEKADNLIILK